jgi:hypothetical protein
MNKNKHKLGNKNTFMIYTFMNKNKHKLGNNISNRDKIRVNLPEVPFSIR